MRPPNLLGIIYWGNEQALDEWRERYVKYFTKLKSFQPGHEGMNAQRFEAEKRLAVSLRAMLSHERRGEAIRMAKEAVELALLLAEGRTEG